MKKINIYLTLFLLVVASACSDDIGLNVTPPQTNPQETAQTVDGFTLTLDGEMTTPVILTDEILASNKIFKVLSATATPNLTEGASLTYALEASNTKEFEVSYPLLSVSENNNAMVKASDLNEVVKSLYGKAPSPRQIFFRVKYYITDGTSSVLMPTPAELGPVTVTPASPVVETAYYLIGDINGWKIDELDDYKFKHSGKDVYEDPIFTILVNNAAGYLKIVPQSSKETASWNGVLGIPVNGNTDLTGNLGGEGAIKVEETGLVKITLNMLEYTYSIELIGEMNLTLYVPGSHQQEVWNPETAPTLYSRNFDLKYDGYVYFSGPADFKFTSEPNWNGTNYGSGANGTLSTDGGAGNLNVNDKGYYQLIADLSGSPYTYSIIKTEWGLIGDATPGGWDNSTPMTYDSDRNIWAVTTSLAAGKNFKFRANNTWDINLGGEVSNLTYNGDNISITNEGNYLIELDLSDPTAYKYSITKQ